MSQNPWFSIWCNPRSTIAGIVAKNPNRSLWWLAAIYGFCSLMNFFQSMVLGASISTGAILILAIILSPIWGYLNFTIWSGLVTWVGKWFKGEGHFKEIRAAYAWSCVPIVLNIPLWVLMVILFGHQLFLNFPDAHLLTNGMVTLLFVILIIKVILAVWSLVIYLNALAEVQHYTVMRSILTVLVTAVVLSLIFCLLFYLLAYATGHASPSGALFMDKQLFETVRKL